MRLGANATVQNFLSATDKLKLMPSSRNGSLDSLFKQRESKSAQIPALMIDIDHELNPLT